MPKTLDPAMRELCEQLIAACKETGERIEACIACGLEMQEEQQVNAEQLAVATKLLNNPTLNGK